MSIYIGRLQRPTASPVYIPQRLFHQDPTQGAVLEGIHGIRARERCATTPPVIHSDVGLLSKEGGSRRPQNRTSDSLIRTIYMEGEGG